MTNAAAILDPDFATLSDVLRAHGRERPDKTAVVDERAVYTYAELDGTVDRIAAALQRDGISPGQSVAIVAAASIEYAAVFLGALRAGCVVVPLAPSSKPESLIAMMTDCGAHVVFVDADSAAAIAGEPIAATQIRLDTHEFAAWLAPAGTRPAPVTIDPTEGFNVIYSSGTTGTPQGNRPVAPDALVAHLQQRRGRL